MHEHELWFTALLNQYLAGPANAILHAAGIHVHDPAKPWSNYMSMEILVILLLAALALFMRPRLSVDKPGKIQQTLEVIYEFLSGQAHDVIGHGHGRFVAFFATIFLFILTSNLLGVVPTFESPTMYYYVPTGIALATFLYYNVHGFRAQGFVGYLKHFAGPVWWLMWFMFPLEIISHLIRPLSLTIRLYANMLAGEEVTLGFLALVPVLVPVVFMGLHIFVSFIQAFIFTVLAMAYVGGAVSHEEH